MEIRGKKERIEFRLTITGGESLATPGMIWIEDAALFGVWSYGPQKIGAELKDGAEVIAFYNSPDRSGAFAKEIWYFGRLNKSKLDR